MKHIIFSSIDPNQMGFNQTCFFLWNELYSFTWSFYTFSEGAD